MPLFRRSEESETRTLTAIGVSLALTMVIAVALLFVIKPFADQPRDLISITMDMPYVGQGVGDGTPVIMHGMQVGQVTEISRLAGGGVRLRANLQAKPTNGLTDAMAIDFRPSNYFGVTGINLLHKEGGQPLRNGTQIKITPAGNFTLQAMLYRLGDISGIFDQRLIGLVERATRYVDALDPLLETMIVVATSVTNVQTVGTEELLRNATGIGVTLPGLTDALISTSNEYRTTIAGTPTHQKVLQVYNNNPYLKTYDAAMLKRYRDIIAFAEAHTDEYAFGPVKEGLAGVATDLFGALGKLLYSHINDLFPVVEQIRLLAGVVPKLISPPDIADTLKELRTRLVRMYEGSGDQRALQVRIILDELPGVAAPLNLALGAAG